MLDTVQDINKIPDYYSYENFYVVYCKFWELDTDHDMIISREDMRQHSNGAITDAIIDRVFSGAVMRTPPELRTTKGKGPCRDQPTETIGFEDFVCFLLAEEDKKHPTSQEYWFRILDMDGDGVISLYEMEYFYREIERKLTQHKFDTLAFKDVACNVSSNTL
jgi:serine/threonine-protein phosphatase 2A regulatory subunit B''